MTQRILNSSMMRALLVKRFMIAMLVICCTTIYSLVAVFTHISQNERDAHLINISGRQRMLSQRIALLTPNTHADLRSQQSINSLCLADCIAWMRDAHVELSQESQTSEKRKSLFAGPDGLNELVDRFLNAASASLTGRATPTEKEFIQQAAQDGAFLGKLDRVVASYEADYEQKLSNFKIGESVLLAISLLAIAAVTLLVFRPIVGLVESNLKLLEGSNSELIEFSYRISHDLRSPVVSALGITEVTKEAIAEKDLESAEEGVRHVSKSLGKVSATIEDIVSLVKQKMTDIPSETFNLAEVVNDCIDGLSHLPGFDSIDLQVECPGDLELHTKRVYLKQTIENLLSNAIKYRDPTVGHSRVALSTTVVGEACKIAVEDNGLGIDEGYRDRLFSMFQRFHPDTAFGTGLGLYLVKQNAAALRGKIHYHPTSEGSRFEFSFPTSGA